MTAPHGLNSPVDPSETLLAISDSRQGGSSDVAGNATISTTPVDNALYMSLRFIGTGVAPNEATTGAKAAPGVIIFAPLKSAIDLIGLAREMNTAWETVYMSRLRTSL